MGEQLESFGVYVCPNFLPDELWQEVRKDLDRIYANDLFKRAGTGKGQAHSVHEDVRRDEIYWLETSAQNEVQLRLANKLTEMKEILNRQLFLGVKNFEGHYAVYPAGGFYKRHLDCFHQDDSRVVSLILYLNRDWKNEDGGQLKIFGEKEIEVPPIGNTLVCFMSREIEHEVLTSHAPRYSFTGWFKV